MKTKSLKIEVVVPLLNIVSDSIAILLSFYLAYWTRFLSTFFIRFFPAEKGIPPLSGYLWFAVFTLPVWILVFQTFKLYKLNRVVFIFDEFFSIVKCVTISLIFSIGIIFFFRDFPYSRIVFILVWFYAVILITIFRYITLKIEKTFYNKQIGVKKVAVVGCNKKAYEIYRRLESHSFTGFKVVGYFCKENAECNAMEKATFLGNYDVVPRKIKDLEIQKLLISLPSSEHTDLFTLIKKCEGINVEFMLVPDFLELVTSKLRIIEVDGIPFMRIKSIPLNVWDRAIKRTFDIVFSSVIIFVLSPVFLILAFLVKVTSPGPIIYRQERIGLDGKKFEIFKFRSMRVDAEKEGPRFATQNDQRYTPIGKFIRKYSLDELPQFFNVLKGDMSIVGPRPEREVFIEQMKHTIDKYLERHRVKCGITGWAQVNGLRGETDMQERINYDIYYIENWSLAFDIKIIAKTLREIFYSKTAV